METMQLLLTALLLLPIATPVWFTQQLNSKLCTNINVVLLTLFEVRSL